MRTVSEFGDAGFENTSFASLGRVVLPRDSISFKRLAACAKINYGIEELSKGLMCLSTSGNDTHVEILTGNS